MGNTKSKYSGCGITTIIFIAIVIFCIANDIGNNLLIWALIVGGVILDLFISTRNKTRQKNENNSDKQIHISEEYFNRVNEAIENLLNIHNSLQDDTKCIGFFYRDEENKFNWLLENGTKITSIKEKIRLSFLIDIIKCYGIEKPIDLCSKKGVGLFLIVMRISGIEKGIAFDYYKRFVIDEPFLKTAEKTLRL